MPGVSPRAVGKQIGIHGVGYDGFYRGVLFGSQTGEGGPLVVVGVDMDAVHEWCSLFHVYNTSRPAITVVLIAFLLPDLLLV